MVSARRAGDYGFAVLVTGAAVVLPLALPHYVQQPAVFLVFSLAVMSASLRGGLGPGLLATLLGGAGCLYWFIEPRDSFQLSSPHDAVALALFFLVGSCVSGIAAALHGFRRSLRRSNDELLRADRRKDEFLAMLGHELRNPMAAIRHSTSLLDDPRPDVAQRARRILDRQGRLVSRLVDDLLDATRLTTGKMALHIARVQLNPLVARALESSASALGNGAAPVIHFAPAPGDVWLEADPQRIEQVVENLVGNAVKFTQEGGEISVETASEGGSAVIRVSDTGVGIPPERLGRLFVMFEQLDEPRGRERGLGIGLALVKQLVGLHGGTVEARSEGHGKGSQFTVRLPRAATPPAPEPSIEVEAPTHPVRRLLIVEDNPDAADVLAALLRSWGNEVAVASDGVSALAEARAHPPEIVLMDLGLPGLDGFEVARRLREMSETRSAYIAAVSGFGGADDRRHAKAAGFDAYLIKPVDPQALQRLLSQPSIRS
jgi:signal transduction histidine kinase